VFSALVVGFTLLKRAPLLIEKVWDGFFSTTDPLGVFKKFIKFFINILWSVYYCFTDFLFAYYSLFIVVAILGLVVHPFFFVIQLFDVLRNEILKNVVKAVWDPRVQLLLTFIVFLLCEYYFTLIGYTFFSQHYIMGTRCQSLWQCFFSTFDFTFKSGGAVGGILMAPEMYGGTEANGNPHVNQGIVVIGRWFFDNGFKIIMVLVIINMVAGIIIDTFGRLKEDLKKKEEDISDICFVCGIEKEKLEKSSFGFVAHIKRDHYLWNYIFYRAYLDFKSVAERNGIETHIAAQITSNDLSWFPVGKALCIKDEEDGDNLKSEIVRNLQNKMEYIRDSLTSQMQKVVQFAKLNNK